MDTMDKDNSNKLFFFINPFFLFFFFYTPSTDLTDLLFLFLFRTLVFIAVVKSNSTFKSNTYRIIPWK